MAIPPRLLIAKSPADPSSKCSSQNDSDNTFTVSPGGAPKKGINRRSMPIFPGSTRKRNVAIVEHEMTIGRSYINATTFDLVSFSGLDDRNRATAVKNAAECTGSANMDYHKDRSWQIPRKRREERAKRLDAPSGSSNDDNIARSQKTSPFA